MNPKEIRADVGIIVGRFQVPELHEAHCDLIESVIQRHHKVIIFLGLSPCKTTFNNPLDFESRKQLVLQKYPDVLVLYIKDEASDEVWSKKVDAQIEDVLGPNQTAAIYGSRDSFIPHYKGGYPTVELEPTRIISGTELRKEASNKVKASPDFRAGVIWAVANQFPCCLPTVDVAIFDKATQRVLMARKPNERLYRFVGGFAQPNTPSYEADAKRETMEETGLEVADLTYIGSTQIDDWRYRKEVNKIKTLMFIGFYIFGRADAKDDIAESRWYELTKINEHDIVPEHRPLLEMFKNWCGKNPKAIAPEAKVP
jgi:bifunctional NMN adenylyltransferase/nudix hydrolase